MIGNLFEFCKKQFLTEVEIKIRHTDPTFVGVEVETGIVQIFSIDVDACYDRTEICYQGVLSRDEIKKAERYYHIHDRASYLVRKYFLRMLLSKLISRPPCDLNFSTIGSKKPIITGLEFNTSHSGTYAVIAISSASVGIDIEEIDHTFDFNDIVNRCFTFEEQKVLNEPNPIQHFFKLWTRKEAILKASGEGLISDLHLLDCLSNRIWRKGHIYDITTFYPEAGYVLSLASECTSSKLVFWKISPLSAKSKN